MSRPLAASLAIAFALVPAACAPGTLNLPKPTTVKPADDVTIKGKVLTAAGKPLTAGEIRLARITADLTKVFTDQSANGEVGALGADGAFSFKRKGHETIDAGAAANHTVLVTTPDGALARHTFFPTKATTELAPIKLWDGVKADVDATSGAATLTVTPPAGANLGAFAGRNARVYRGTHQVWEAAWDSGPHVLPSYLFDPGTAYRAQSEYTAGETFYKSPYHAFTAVDAGRARILAVASAKNEKDVDMGGLIDGKIEGPTGIDASTVIGEARWVILDLGAAKAVDRVVFFGLEQVAQVMVGNDPDATGGKVFKAANSLWQDLDVDGTGRYVRVDFVGPRTLSTVHEVRVIGPK